MHVRKVHDVVFCVVVLVIPRDLYHNDNELFSGLKAHDILFISDSNYCFNKKQELGLAVIQWML